LGRGGVRMAKGRSIERIYSGRWYLVVGAIIVLCSQITACGNSRVKGDDRDRARTGVQAISSDDRLYDVSVVGDRNIWVVGYFGKIVHSADGGKTWVTQNAGLTKALLSVSFVNERDGWAVGESGTILHTNDGGATWVKQNSTITGQQLLRVQFLSEKQGFAVGSNGLVLHTSDAGVTWERFGSLKGDLILNDVVFLNPNNGWVVGEFDTILHTKDGGKTWQKQYGADPELAGQEGKLFGVAFRDPLCGVAVGTGGKTLVTADGGKSWSETNSSVKDTLLKVQFFGDSRVLAVGLRGALIKSFDNGQTWSPVAIPNHYGWLSGIGFTKDGTGILVGDRGKIFVGAGGDGGRWSLVGR
jgi:photosystem II stability/assembly factor-like uncharacterized protein